MANEDIFAKLADLILDADEFGRKHPVVSFVLSIVTLVGFERISDLLQSYSDSDPQTYNPSIIEQNNAAQLKQLEDKLHMTLDELIWDGRDKLTFLETHPRLKLATPDFRNELQKLVAVFDQLRDMNRMNREYNAEGIRQWHQFVVDLHGEYTRFEASWQAARSEWRTRWTQVRDLVDQGKDFALPMDTSAGQETVRIDCEFWSRSALSEAGKALPPLEQPEDTTIETFTTLIRQADQLYQRIVSIIQQASQDFLASQMRIQLANSISDSLYSRGWYLEQESDFAFTANDERADLRLKLHSPVSDQVEFILRPDNTMTMRPAFKNMHNRSPQQILARVLQSALRDSGITVQHVDLQ